MYMPGRLRTASSPLRTVIDPASYCVLSCARTADSFAMSRQNQGVTPSRRRNPPGIHRIDLIRPVLPVLIRARMVGVIRPNSLAHGALATRTRSTPSAVTESGSVTRAICGPTSRAQSSSTLACCTRRERPADLRYLSNASLSTVGPVGADVRRLVFLDSAISCEPYALAARNSELSVLDTHSSTPDPPHRQLHAGSQLVCPRRGDEHLSLSYSPQPSREPFLPLLVQLGEDIVQQ